MVDVYLKPYDQGSYEKLFLRGLPQLDQSKSFFEARAKSERA